ncbi:hypothetical protein EDC04DRAFT_2613463 [Pisolithus marmoratus]|nr:hypothetical protein EDC04DRAFT_2613463 [Pisolithus marmoratus]
MSSSERSKVSFKRKLGADETNDTVTGTRKVVESHSETRVKKEEDLEIVVPLNIDSIKTEGDAEPEVIQISPVKRQKVRFSTSVSYKQARRRTPVHRRAPQLATKCKSSRRVGGKESGPPRPTKEPEAQRLSTRQGTDNERQLENRKLESRLEAALAEAESIPNMLAQILLTTERISQEINSIRAGMNAQRNGKT